MKLFSILFIIFLSVISVKSNENIIIDSKMTLKDAIKMTKAPSDIIEKLILLDVKYYDFKGELHQGQLVIDKDLKRDVEEAFKLILDSKFPIAKVIPIVKYSWNDIESMKDNNTSAFNYRVVAGSTRLSNHALGRAIDFNPFINPAIYSDGSVSPPGAKYNPSAKGAINENSPITKFFKDRGWRWGGDWTTLKDYQHFDLPLEK